MALENATPLTLPVGFLVGFMDGVLVGRTVGFVLGLLDGCTVYIKKISIGIKLQQYIHILRSYLIFI